MSARSFQQRLGDAVESIRGWAMTDSLVDVDPVELRRALQFDSMSSGRLPTEDECEQLVCGSDDGGEVPLAVQVAFPKVHALLNDYWNAEGGR